MLRGSPQSYRVSAYRAFKSFTLRASRRNKPTIYTDWNCDLNLAHLTFLTGLIAVQIAWEFQFIQVLALGFVKLSVLFFYRRIFSIKVAHQPFDIATRSMIWIIILWTISFFFASFFSCGTHLDANWTTVESFIQYCVNLNFEIAFAVSDMICDLFILILPLPMVCASASPVL